MTDHDRVTGASAAPVTRATRVREAAIGVVCLVLGIAALIAAQSISVSGGASARFSPRWWPDILSWMVIFLSVVQIAVALFGRREPTEPPPPVPMRDILRLACIALLIVGFIMAWSVLDFRVSASLFLFGLIFVLGSRRWYQLTLVPIGASLLIYVVFHDLFRVPL